MSREKNIEHVRQDVEDLERSLEHWSVLTDAAERRDGDRAGRENWGTLSCALCQSYFMRASTAAGVACDGCPIKERTGKDGCRGTPYQAADRALEELCHWLTGDEGADVEAVAAERDYIASILEEYRERLDKMEDESNA